MRTVVTVDELSAPVTGSMVTAQLLAFNLSAHSLLPMAVGFFMLFASKRSAMLMKPRPDHFTRARAWNGYWTLICGSVVAECPPDLPVKES